MVSVKKILLVFQKNLMGGFYRGISQESYRGFGGFYRGESQKDSSGIPEESCGVFGVPVKNLMRFRVYTVPVRKILLEFQKNLMAIKGVLGGFWGVRGVFMRSKKMYTF